MAKCSSCGRNLGTFSFGKKQCQWCVDYEKQQRGEGKNEEFQRVMPTPWKAGAHALGGVSFNQLFVGVNLLVFMAMVASGISLMSGPNPSQMIHWGGNFGPLTLGGEPWRLVTYMFLHYGLIHIGFNMWCLWDLGALAESLYGDWTFAFVYLACGLGGGICSLWWHPGSVSAGASGAIFGLAGALLASLKLGEFSLPRAMISGTLRSVVAFVIYNIILGGLMGFTDNACHIGGLVTGLILGALIAKLAPARDAIANRVVILGVVLLIIFGCWRWVNHSYGFLVVGQRGEMLLRQGKTDDALAELQRAARMRPDYAAAHYNLAHAYEIKGDYANEIAELKRLVELDPKDGEARYNLGIALLNANQLPQARDTFQQMLTANFRSADAHVGLGMVAAAEHNDPMAVQEFETATNLDEDTDAYYDLGSAYLRLKRYDDAIAALQKHQQISESDDYQTETALAEAYRAKGMTKESADAVQKATALKSP
jgi:membrane associated rhomboid family serine protease/Flp pilus assembly protein TadD